MELWDSGRIPKKQRKEAHLTFFSILLECSCLAALVGIWAGVAQTHKDAKTQKENNFLQWDLIQCESHHEGNFLFQTSTHNFYFIYFLFQVTFLSLVAVCFSSPCFSIWSVLFLTTHKIQTLSLFHGAYKQLLFLNWFSGNYVMPVSWTKAYQSVSCLWMYTEWEYEG